MGSIGGLDVPYGASSQIVRTNTLVVETDAGAGFTVAVAGTVLTATQNAYPSTIAPDYIAFVASGALTEGYNDAHSGQVSDGGVLNAITAVPAAGNQGGTAANQRGLAFDAILNVGVAQINADDTMTQDDLFLSDIGEENTGGTEASGATTDAALLAELNIADNFTSANTLQSQLMAAQFAAMNLTSGSGSTHGRGGADGRVQTLDLTTVLGDSGVLGGTALTGTVLSDLTATSTAAAINDALAGSAALVSVLSICSVV